MAGRTRRTADEAKRLILDAAATLLATGGVAAVQVRAVAAAAGMTDAGVNHHFGSRDQLLEALLRHGGRRLRRAVDAVVAGWLDGAADVEALVEALAEVYRQGYGELAISLHAAGWRDRSSGLLEPVVDALHARRTPPASRDDTGLAVAALHQAVALESAYGAEFRRAAGFPADRAADAGPQMAWWVAVVDGLLSGPTCPR